MPRTENAATLNAATLRAERPAAPHTEALTEVRTARTPAAIVRRAGTLLTIGRHEVEAAWEGRCHALGPQGQHRTVITDTRMRPGCDCPASAAHSA